MRDSPSPPALSFPASLAERRSQLAGRLQDRRQVFQHAVGLRRNVAAEHLLRRRINGHLSRDKNKTVGSNRLRIRPDRLGRIGSRNNVAHVSFL